MIHRTTRIAFVLLVTLTALCASRSWRRDRRVSPHDRREGGELQRHAAARHGGQWQHSRADAHFPRRRSRAHPCDECDEGGVVDSLARPAAAEPHGWRAVRHVSADQAGRDFHYEFRIRQRGTYWYHSHTALQEQKGLYGAIVILPRSGGVSGDRDRRWCSRIGRMKIRTKCCAGSSAAASGRRFSAEIRSR